MNERIRELALQARNYALDEKRIYERVHNIEQCMEEYREVYNEKFAELLIEKCIKAASDPGDGLIKGNTWHDGVRACVWSIQQEFNLDRSFGVEP